MQNISIPHKKSNSDFEFLKLLKGLKSCAQSKNVLLVEALIQATLFVATRGTGSLQAEVYKGQFGIKGPAWNSFNFLRRFLEHIQLMHFNLSYDKIKNILLQTHRNSSTPVISFWNIFQNKSIAITLFVLPQGTRFELHSHPGMVVLTKVLYGSLKVLAGSILSEKNNFSSANHSLPENFSIDTKPDNALNIAIENFVKEFDNDLIDIFKSVNVFQISQITPSLPVYDFGAVPIKTSQNAMTNIDEWSSPIKSSNSHIIDKDQSCKADTQINTDHLREKLYKKIILYARKAVQINKEYLFLELFNGVIKSKHSNNFKESIFTEEFLNLLSEEFSSVENLVTDLYVDKSQNLLSTVMCSPTIGNLHQLEADLGPAVILDIVTPPYDMPEKRGCDIFKLENLCDRPVDKYKLHTIRATNQMSESICSFVEFKHDLQNKDIQTFY